MTVVQITASGTWTVPAGVTSLSNVAIVGGGGPGGGLNSTGGGGGGGQVVFLTDYAVTPGQVITVVIGAGGQGGENGDPSSFDGNVAAGGAAGGDAGSGNGASTNGGGGGGGSVGGSGGASTGTGADGGAGSSNWGGGGGGGVAGAAGDGDAASSDFAGDGGDGDQSGLTIFGSTSYGDNGWLAGGGGGGEGGLGGQGGGGNGAVDSFSDGQDGLANTGGGGGGGAGNNDSGHGGSGVILIKFTAAPTSNIMKWDSDANAPLTGTWKSGRIVCDYPCNLGAARVVAESYPVTLVLWNDQGDQVTSRTVSSDDVIRLPSGYLTSWFEVEVVSDDKVYTVHVAETVEELLPG